MYWKFLAATNSSDKYLTEERKVFSGQVRAGCQEKPRLFPPPLLVMSSVTEDVIGVELDEEQ